MPFTTKRQTSNRRQQTTPAPGQHEEKAPGAFVDRVKKVLAGFVLTQAMLGALILFAGGLQLILPVAAMAKPSDSGLLLEFVNAAQFLKAIDLMLPSLVQTMLGRISALVSIIIVVGLVRWTSLGNQPGTTPCPGCPR